MAKKRKYTQLPLKTRQERARHAERLLAMGASLQTVVKAQKKKYGRAQNWRTLKQIQQAALAGKATVADTDQGNELEAALVSVQPMRQVSSRMRVRLQGLVNDMQKGGIEKLTIDSAGSVQVVFTPAEQIFDLQEG